MSHRQHRTGPGLGTEYVVCAAGTRLGEVRVLWHDCHVVEKCNMRVESMYVMYVMDGCM